MKIERNHARIQCPNYGTLCSFTVLVGGTMGPQKAEEAVEVARAAMELHHRYEHPGTQPTFDIQWAQDQFVDESSERSRQN